MSVQKTFGTILRNNPVVNEESKRFRTLKASLDVPLPKNFDGRKAWSELISGVKNQGSCGNCWAQAVCNMLENRFTILTKGKINLSSGLSTIQLTICEYTRDADFLGIRDDIAEHEALRKQGHKSSACNGNSLYNSINFLYRYGVPTLQCVDPEGYKKWCETEKPPCQDLSNFTSDEYLPTCYDLLDASYSACMDGDTAIRYYRAYSYYNVPADEIAIMTEIYKWGPVACGYMVYSDFLVGYDGKSIYTHPDKSAQLQGGHAVMIIGWGEEEQDGRNVKYWLIENSWSDKWGDGGYCRIERGIPELQLEQNVVAVMPDIPFAKYTETQKAKFKEADADTYTDEQRRAEFDLDPITGYRKIAIEEIKQGKLKGQLTPLIDKKDAPDLTNFVAGLVQAGGNLKTTSGILRMNRMKEVRGNVVKYGLIILVALVIVYFARKMINKRY